MQDNLNLLSRVGTLVNSLSQAVSATSLSTWEDGLMMRGDPFSQVNFSVYLGQTTSTLFHNTL
jgi:hypothetical protein